MPDWVTDNQQIFLIMGIASVVIFFTSLMIMPALIVRIPTDYFTHQERPPGRWATAHPAVRLAILIGKNLFGAMLVLGGLAMLVLPGQGLLTIFAGVVLLDFPRKYAFERWLVGRRWVHRPVNWLRRKRHREPLKLITGRQPETRDSQ